MTQFDFVPPSTDAKLLTVVLAVSLSLASGCGSDHSHGAGTDDVDDAATDDVVAPSECDLCLYCSLPDLCFGEPLSAPCPGSNGEDGTVAFETAQARAGDDDLLAYVGEIDGVEVECGSPWLFHVPLSCGQLTEGGRFITERGFLSYVRGFTPPADYDVLSDLGIAPFCCDPSNRVLRTGPAPELVNRDGELVIAPDVAEQISRDPSAEMVLFLFLDSAPELALLDGSAIRAYELGYDPSEIPDAEEVVIAEHAECFAAHVSDLTRYIDELGGSVVDELMLAQTLVVTIETTSISELARHNLVLRLEAD